MWMLSREAWGGMPRASVTLEGPDQLGPEEAPGGEGAGGLVPTAGAGLLCTATGSKGEGEQAELDVGRGRNGRKEQDDPTHQGTPAVPASSLLEPSFNASDLPRGSHRPLQPPHPYSLPKHSTLTPRQAGALAEGGATPSKPTSLGHMGQPLGSRKCWPFPWVQLPNSPASPSGQDSRGCPGHSMLPWTSALHIQELEVIASLEGSGLESCLAPHSPETTL